MMCEVLEISQPTYYRIIKQASKDDYDASLIFNVFNESLQTYGYRRIKQALLETYGLVMNSKKIRRLMKEYRIVPVYSKRKKQTAQKKVLEENVKSNLLKRNFTVDKPDIVWVTDITYLTFKGKRLFLSTIMDLYDRKIVSYKIHYLNDIPLVVSTLISARLERYNAQGTIIHSDQGFQYTSPEYQMWCRKFGFQISMSRKGTPLDNAVIESFHSRLKNEVMYNKDFKNINELKQAVFDWIWFYNHGRIKGKRKTIEYINFKEKYKKKNS